MRKKGFTLIELLAVIIILGVLALIIYPMITGIVEKQKQKTYKASMEGIIRTVKNDYNNDNYQTPRIYHYENGKLTLESVNNKEKNEIIKINGKVNGSGYIYVDYNGNIILDYLCSEEYCGYNTLDHKLVVVEKNTGNHANVNLNIPVIQLNGEEIVYVEQNGSYTEYGAIAKTRLGISLNSQITKTIKLGEEVVSKIDTKDENTYTVEYSITNEGKTATVIRTVHVIGVTPVITITPESTEKKQKQTVNIVIKPGTNQTIKQFTYQINQKPEVTIKGTETNIDLKETGNYIIKINVTDENGHKANKISGTYSIDSTKPTITIEEPTATLEITDVPNYDILTGIIIRDNSDINPIVETSGSLNAVLGTQTITYTVTDESGNSATATKKFTIVEANNPILNFSSIETTGWTKSMNVIVTATDTSDLQTFTYEVIKDGKSLGIQNGTIIGNSGRNTVSLSQNGTYTITLTATDKNGNTSELTSGTYQIDNTPPVVNNAIAGTMLYIDPTFEIGTNKVQVYNNKNNGTVALTRKAMTTPTGSGYGIEITNTGEAYPGIGGFAFKTLSASGKILITKIIAKIPVGYTINFYNNSYGTGGNYKWLTSQEGTGEFEEYIIQVNCGTEGTFSTVNYFALTGTTGTTDSPVKWYVAYATTIDNQAAGGDNYITFTATDQSKIVGYGISKSNTAEPTYTTIEGTTNLTMPYNTSITDNGTYYIWVKDEAGNINKKQIKVTNIKKSVKLDNKYYATLATAIDAVPENNTEKTITLLTNLSEKVTIPANKKINYVGGNYALSGQINNYGYLTITSGSITETDTLPLANRPGGTLIINGGTIISNVKQTLYNYGGNLYINGGEIIKNGTIDLGSVVIYDGVLTMTGGKIRSTDMLGDAIYVYEDRNIILKGGTIESSGKSPINSRGHVTLSGATIISNNASNAGIKIYTTGSLTMTSGSVTNTAGGYAIYNEGTASITGGTTSPKNYGV